MEEELEIFLKKINNRKSYMEELLRYIDKDNPLKFYEFINDNVIFIDTIYNLYIKRDIAGFLDFIEDYGIDREVIDTLVDNNALSDEDKYHVLFERLLSIDIEKEDYFKTVTIRTIMIYQSMLSNKDIKKSIKL